MSNAVSITNVKNVMIVDDDPDICDLLSSFLKGLGYTVVTARSARMAIEIIPESKPEIVFIDVMLGDALGTTVERFIRSHSLLYNRTAVVFQTCIDDPEDQSLILQHLPDYVLVKPYSRERLTAALTLAEMNLNIMRSPSKTTGLLPILAFQREIDRLLLRNDAFTTFLFSGGDCKQSPHARDEQRTRISASLKRAIAVGEFFETTAYDIGEGMFAIVSMGDTATRFAKAFSDTGDDHHRANLEDLDEPLSYVWEYVDQSSDNKTRVSDILVSLNDRLSSSDEEYFKRI